MVLGATLLAVAAVWTGARNARRVEAGAPQEPRGEKITLRFFRNPSAISAFTVHDLDGTQLASSGWRGKVLLINFWATWCGPCRSEIPDLVALQEKYRDHLQIIGVSEDDGSAEGVKRFARENRINYPIVMLTPELEKIFPGVYALPTTFVFDRETRLVQKHIGLLTAAVTELETRALAGLSANASIEEVDRAQPVRLENAAQATSIPGIDLSRFQGDRRATLLQRLNAEACTCGCELTVAKCRIDDPTCGVSLPIARRIVQEQLDLASK
jgi:thiol-disulfide isomerase/thioredoxin